MLKNRENIRILTLDSVVLLLAVFFGLFICTNSLRNKTELSRKPVTTISIAPDKTAITSPGVRVQVYQKTWISNKDNFALLAFNRNPLADSRRTEMKIAQLATLRLKSHLPQLFVLLYHLFPDEADEPPSSGYYNIFLS